MINARTVDDCLRGLDALAASTYRKDFRATATRARKLISRLLEERPGAVNLQAVAMEIAEKAADRRILVYRTQRTGAVRWQSLDTPSAVRIPARQVIGTYDAGADWRQILEDINA